MAITRAVSTQPATEQERTWRANLETPRGADYAIQVYREVVQKDAGGEILSARQVMTPVCRQARDVAGESVEVGEQTVSAALILAALPLFFDRWAQEDAAAEEAPAP